MATLQSPQNKDQMESINNTLKGYGKINLDLGAHTDDHPQPPTKATRKRLLITLSISGILLFTLILGLLIGLLIHESKTEPPDENPTNNTTPTNSAQSLSTVCNVTQYPATCFSTISSLNITTKPDPEFIFNLSLMASIKEVKNFTAYIKNLNGAAIDDCVSLLGDSVSQLNDSVAALGGEKMLTLEKINDIQTWVSAAMTDQDTCIEGLKEMESTGVVDEVKKQMEKSKECLSNSLAIVANIQSLLQKFGLTMH